VSEPGTANPERRDEAHWAGEWQYRYARHVDGVRGVEGVECVRQCHRVVWEFEVLGVVQRALVVDGDVADVRRRRQECVGVRRGDLVALVRDDRIVDGGHRWRRVEIGEEGRADLLLHAGVARDADRRVDRGEQEG
jgi:hypothetical protein